MTDFLAENYGLSPVEIQIYKIREDLCSGKKILDGQLRMLTNISIIYSSRGVYFTVDLREAMDELFSAVLIACCSTGINVHTELPIKPNVVICNPRVLICAVLEIINSAIIPKNSDISLKFAELKGKYEISVTAKQFLFDSICKQAVEAAAKQHSGNAIFKRNRITLKLPLKKESVPNYTATQLCDYFSDRYSPLKIMLPSLFE